MTRMKERLWVVVVRIVSKKIRTVVVVVGRKNNLVFRLLCL